MGEPRSPCDEDKDDPGCAYILEECDGRRACGAQRRPASSYCPQHHTLCHVVYGSAAEAERLLEVEALASAVAGRRSRDGGGPSRQFLRRLEQTVQGFPRPVRS